MTPTQRAAAERLADALNEGYAYAMDEAAALLRELLAAEPVQEPVAWMMPNTDSIITSATKTYRGVLGEVHSIPLYAALQQRKPLTREQIDEIQAEALKALVATGWTGGMCGWQWDQASARAIERAHGIGDSP